MPLRAFCSSFLTSAMNHAPAPPRGAEAKNDFFGRVPSAVCPLKCETGQEQADRKDEGVL